jgi:superfamily II DNA or RNA helicase
MTERLFSKQQKRHLYFVSSGLCEQFGHPLGEEWDAHHVNRFADGGKTEIQNARALCKACHVSIHRRVDMIEPRGWQKKALNDFFFCETKSFLLEATPGAGKTIFSGLCAKKLLSGNEIDFVVVVVPTTALKGDRTGGFLGDWTKVGVNLTTVLRSGQGWPRDFHGGVITYQQLPNIADTFDTWAENDLRILFVFDEIHHASESNKWGMAAETCGRASTKILGMTGTPFRGDGVKISFVRYDDEGKAIADYRYGYRNAIADRVCREVFFSKDDGIAEYIYQDQETETRISEASGDEAGRSSRVLFDPKCSKWLENVLDKADETLEEYRAVDVDAGGLIICRAGTDEYDDRHLHQVAALVEKRLGEKPVVVSHEDPDAAAKIESFRRGSTKWICAVRMISEGVDIKRLRVLVMANRPTTELLFRQMVGRVVRVENKNVHEHSTVFMADFPQLREWARQISDEAKAGLVDQEKEKKPREGSERNSGGNFISIGATHEDGGGISDFGEVFTPAEVAYAEKLKRDDPQLFGNSISNIIHLARKMGVQIQPVEEINEPLHIQKKEKRQRINTLARRLALKRNPNMPDYASVWRNVFDRTGIKSIDDLMDNHDLARMEQVENVIRSMLTELDHAA